MFTSSPKSIERTSYGKSNFSHHLPAGRFILLASLFCSSIAPLAASTVTGLTLDEGGFPFTSGDVIRNSVGTTTASYNIWDNETGATLAANNGDDPDVTISYAQSISGGTATAASLNYNVTNSSASDRISTNHAMSSAIAVGTVWTQVMTLNFSPKVTILAQDITAFNISSLNTAGGSAWESAYIIWLDQNLVPFSSLPTESWASAPAVAGTGAFFANDRTTLVLTAGVATNGVNGTFDNPSATAILPTNLGVAGSTRIGGFKWVQQAEKVGTNAGSASFTANFQGLAFTGQIVPEPSTCMLAFFSMAAGLLRRRR
jgi:hypothetical protein